MLRVTIDLVPQGDESKRKVLCVGRISLVGGTPEEGVYRVALSKREEPDSAWLTGMVRGFRRQELGPWFLLERALAVTVGRQRRAMEEAKVRDGSVAGKSGRPPREGRR